MSTGSPQPSEQTRATPVKSDAEFGLHLLALGQLYGVGLSTLRHLVDAYGNLARVWEAPEEDLRQVLTRSKVKDTNRVIKSVKEQKENILKSARDRLENLYAEDVRIIAADAPEFPERLATVPGAPYWLFVQGNVAALNVPLIGIVGARKPSSLGREAASKLASVVAEQGLGIVSGLAEGIDDAAHRTGYLYRAPQVAVLGTGIDMPPFPAVTAPTRTKLLRTGGAIVTEYLPGQTYPDKGRFVERNRIQAALSYALAPVESLMQSGTAHTIRFAERYGRPLFGVYCGRQAPENELIQYLLDHEHPVFDMNKPTQLKRLIEWLQAKVGIENWPSEGKTLDLFWAFGNVLQQFEDISRFIRLTPEHVQWLQEQIAARYEFIGPLQEEGEDGS